MFYGEYSHTLDNKGRFIIPSGFREAVKERGIEKFHITRGLEECLFMFGEAEWRAQEAKFRAMPFTKKDARRFNRIFFSGAVEVVFDGQWRVLVPDYLKEYAHLNRDIKIIGVADRIEIWDKAKWDEYYSVSKKEYEDIAENLMDTV